MGAANGVGCQACNYCPQIILVGRTGKPCSLATYVVADRSTAGEILCARGRDPGCGANSIGSVGNYCQSRKVIREREKKARISYRGIWFYRSTAGARFGPRWLYGPGSDAPSGTVPE